MAGLGVTEEANANDSPDCERRPGRTPWLLTTPAVIVQAVTGIALARLAGFPLLSGWLLCATALYLLAGACWFPVLRLQILVRDLAPVRPIETGHRCPTLTINMRGDSSGLGFRLFFP
jgi:uncharacterized membrane protein